MDEIDGQLICLGSGIEFEEADLAGLRERSVAVLCHCMSGVCDRGRFSGQEEEEKKDKRGGGYHTLIQVGSQVNCVLNMLGASTTGGAELRTESSNHRLHADGVLSHNRGLCSATWTAPHLRSHAPLGVQHSHDP